MKTSCEIKYFNTNTDHNVPAGSRVIKSITLVDDKYIFAVNVDKLDVKTNQDQLTAEPVIEMSLEVKSRNGLVIFKGPLTDYCDDNEWKHLFYTSTLRSGVMTPNQISGCFKRLISHRLFVNLLTGSNMVCADNKPVDFKHLALYFSAAHHHTPPKTSTGHYRCGFSMGSWGDFEIRYAVTYSLDYQNPKSEIVINHTFIKLMKAKHLVGQDKSRVSFSTSYNVVGSIPSLDDVKAYFTEQLTPLLQK